MTPTPVMTAHARERCAEMGLSTKVAKAILRHADVRRPAGPDTDDRIATCRAQPGYAVVYVESEPRPIIVTVLFNTTEAYERAGMTFVPIEERAC